MAKSTAIQPGTENNLLSQQDEEFSYKEMLVYGYMRDLEQSLFDDIIIPIDVIHICLKYFSHNEVLLIHLPISLGVPLCVKARNNFYSQHRLRIFELNNIVSKNHIQDSTRLTTDLWRMEKASLTFKQNIKLPPIVTAKLNQAYNKYYRFDIKSEEGGNIDNYYKHGDTDTYSIIFNRGSGHQTETASVWNKKCYAIAFNDRELYKSDLSTIVGFKYSLPTCKRELSQLLYSERYGLIAVGGGISIYNLSFRNKHFYAQDKKQWKWLSFGHLQARRKDFSTVMLDAKRLMVVGGDSRVRDANSELIDLSGHRNERTKVTNCNISRDRCGIMYDNYNKRVFVAGGRGGGKDEYYDVEKDQWIIYAQRGFGREWPTIYSADKVIIYTTDNKGNIWSIDLRENKNYWKQFTPNIRINLQGSGHRVVS